MAAPEDPPLELTGVLAEEAVAIHAKELDRDSRLYVQLNGLQSAALCASGGGIRSASFALGVVQALAARSLPDGAKADAAKQSIL